MINFVNRGDFKDLNKYLKKIIVACSAYNQVQELKKLGRKGVEALIEYTPKRTGKAASSWRFEVVYNNEAARVDFYNEDIENGFPVAIMLQYGHATKNGSWVEGVDYINPALRPIFEQYAEETWRVITNV